MIIFFNFLVNLESKTKDINIMSKYNLEFNNLYDINAENTIKGLSIRSDTI